VQVVGIKEIQKHRKGSWQIVLAGFLHCKRILPLGFCFWTMQLWDLHSWNSLFFNRICIQWQKPLPLLPLAVLSEFQVLFCLMVVNFRETWASWLELNKWWNPNDSWESRLRYQRACIHNRRPQSPLAGPPEIIRLLTLEDGSYRFLLRRNKWIGQSHPPNFLQHEIFWLKQI